MQVYTRLADLGGRFSRTTVALGTFDGVHIGHQKIIDQAVAIAGKSGGVSVVVTFSNHPLSFIVPDRCPPLIVTPDYKIALIAARGADILVNLAFDQQLLRLAPETFLDLLLTNLRPFCLVVGPNYTFGYRGAGTPALLAAVGRERGFEVVVPPVVEVDGVPVSSTFIRQLVLAGEVARAATLLGRPFRISGVVEKGEGRGRLFGFPTANIAPAAGQVIPDEGVYAAFIHCGGFVHRGVANIGTNPTFHGTVRRIEAHILDFAGDLYGQTIHIDFLDKLRDEQTFAGPKELQEQIGRDIAAAQSYFK